jgi:DNA primase
VRVWTDGSNACAGSSVLSETFVRLLAERYALDTAEGRSQCAHAAVALISTVNDPLFRTQLCELIGERTQSPRTQIEAMLGQPEAGAQTAPTAPRGADAASGSAAPRGPNQLWSALLARVLQLPQADWRDPGIMRLVAAGGRAPEILGSILDRIEANPGISTARLLEQFRDASFFPRLMQLASLPLGVEEPELSRRVALDSADRLFREHCRERMRSLSSQADRPLEPEEIEELRRLQALLAQGEGAGNRGE